MVYGLLMRLLALQADHRRVDDTRPTVVVRGCLHGSTLKAVRADTQLSRVDTYRLKIPKSLSAALKEHQGHEEELSGVLTASRTRMGGSKTKQVGSRTKITIGADDERIGGEPDTPELAVQTFTHVAPACQQ